MLARTAELVGVAAAGGTGIAAFNVVTLEHAESIVDGAQRAERSVILQISENTIAFHNGQLAPIAAGARELAIAASVPVALHLDHVTDMDLLRAAPGCGFSSAMFDASTVDYAGNIEATAAAADFCHAHGLWLEGELGEVGGKGNAHAPGVRTDPGQARDYTAATGLDILAVAVGSQHAMTGRTARLDRDLIGALRDAVPVPLVLHGSSGVPDDELRHAVAAGIVKVNIGTALNLAYTGALRATLGDAVDPRKALSAARAAMSRTVEELLMVVSPPPAVSG
jgi:fructose-bisphosphate aldolase class II